MAQRDTGSSRSIQQILSKAMIKPIKVTANLGEMIVKGSMKEYVTNNMPAFSGFLDANSDIGRSMVTFMKNPRDVISRGMDRIDDSETVKAAKKIAEAAIDDLKTGKLFDPARDRDGNGDLLGDFGGFDFGGFDDDGNWDDSFDDGSNDADVAMFEKSEDNADLRTEATITAIGTATEATNKTNLAIHKEDIKSALKRHTQTMTSLTNITTMTAAIHETMNNHLTAMTEMSREMHNQMVSEVREIKNILTEIRDHQIPKKQESRYREDPFPIDRYTGALDLKKYAKYVVQNAMSSQGLDLVAGALDPEMIGSTLSQNPLQLITDALVNAIIPKSTKKKMSTLDKSIKGFFPSLLNKLYNYGEDPANTGAKSFLASIFGVKAETKGYIDPSKYNKDKVDFTGKMAKALTEVIPSQLSQIISLMSGTSAKLYDYDKGKFVDAQRAYAELARRRDDYSADMYDTKFAFQKRIDNSKFNASKEQKRELEDAVYKFLNGMAENHAFINPEKLSEYDFGGLSFTPDNIETQRILYAMLKSFSHDEMQTISADIMAARNNKESTINRLQEELNSSGLSAMLNGLNLSGKERRAIADAASKTDRNIAGMSNEDYHKALGDTVSKFRPISLPGLLSDIKNILNRGIITYQYTPAGDMAKYINAERNKAFKALGMSIGPNIDVETDEEKAKREESIKGKYKEYFKGSGNKEIDMQSSMDDLIEGFSDIDGEIYRVYENEEEQKRYEKFQQDKDKVKGKFTKPFEGIRNFLMKPFDLVNRGLDAMNRSLYRIVFGDSAADALTPDGGTEGESSIITGVTSAIKGNLTSFADWFKDTIGEKLFGDEDSPFSRIKNKVKEFGKDKGKTAWDKLTRYVAGSKNDDTGDYEGGRFSNAVNGVRGFLSGSADKVKEQTEGYLDSFKTAINNVLYGEGQWRQEVDKNGNKVGAAYYMRGTTGIVGMFKEAGQNLKDFLFGTNPDSESKKTWDNVTSEVKKALPGAGAGAVIGGVGTLGAGLLGGLWLPGGPIFGAMLGSAAGFVGASDQLKNYLFGPQLDPEDPSKGRKGGLIEKDVQDAVKQYVPKIGVGAGIGALAGNFGLLPAGLGPVAGAAIGSFGGLIGANKEFRELIFGNEEDDDSGYISKNTRKKIAKMIPGAITGGLGVNAIVGAMNGMGLLPSLISMPGGPVVTAIGALTGTFAGPKIHEFFFGKKDEHGKWIPGEEGVFGKMFNFGKEKLFDPFFNRVNEMAKGVGKWFGDQIMAPLKKAMDPIKEQLKNGGGIIKKTFKFFGRILKDAIDGVFSRIFGKPLSAMADALAKKLRGATNFIVTSIGKAIGGAIAAPFKLIGGIGEHLGKKQAKKRNKRFKAWLKEHPGGTEEEFDAFDRANGHIVSGAIGRSYNKMKQESDAIGNKGSKDDPVAVDAEQAKADREYLMKSAINNMNTTEKAMAQNDKVNPINSAQARTATAVEKFNDKFDSFVDWMKHGRKGKSGDSSGNGNDQLPFDDIQSADDSSMDGSGIRGQMGIQMFADKTGGETAKVASDAHWSYTGRVEGTDVRREDEYYRSLYRRFNSRIANAKTPKAKQKAMDEIILTAPTGKQDEYRKVLTDIARLNNPDDSYTGGMAGQKSDDDDDSSGGGILDFLSSNAGILGGIAGLLLSMMGGNPGNFGSILAGVLGAKAINKVVKIGKGIWNFGTKAKSAIMKAKDVLTYGMNSQGASLLSSIGGLAAGGSQLMDDDSKNNSIGVHNIYNVLKRGGLGVIKNSVSNGLDKAVNAFAKPGTLRETAVLKAMEYSDRAKSAVKSLGKTAGENISKVSSKIVAAVKSGLDKIVRSKTVQKLAGTMAAKLPQFVTKTTQYISKNIPNLLKTAGSKVKSGLKQVSSVLTGGVITAAFSVYDFISGMGDAYRYFEVSPSDATKGMQLCAGFCKTVVGLLSCIPVVGFALSLIPVGPLAKLLYKLVADDDSQTELVKNQQKAKQELEQYNAENGTDLSMDEYLKQKDGEENGKHWWQKAGSAVKRFFTGDSASQTMDESRVTRLSSDKYSTTQKPPKGIRYTTSSFRVDGKFTNHYILDKSAYDEWKKKSSGSGRGRWGHGPNTVFSQTDPKWTSQDPTMKDSGCGPTVAAMMAERLGRGANPVEASQMAYAGGYRDSSGGTNPEFFGAYGRAHGVNMHEGSTDSASIGSSLDSGSPVALMGQGGAFGSGSHYLLADKKNGNNVSLIDPIGGKRISSSLSSLAGKTTAAIYGRGANPNKNITKVASKASGIATEDECHEPELAGVSISGRGRWGRGTTMKNGVVYFLQADSRWGNKSTGGSRTIGSAGCVITSLAMCVSTVAGKEITPYDITTKYKYTLSGGGMIWGNMTKVAGEFGGEATAVSSKDAVLKAVSEGKPVLVWGPKPNAPVCNWNYPNGAAGGPHAVVICKLSSDGKTVRVNDPASEAHSNMDIPVSAVHGWDQAYAFSKKGKGVTGNNVTFNGSSDSSSDDSSDSSSKTSSAPTGLSLLTNKITEKFNPITEAITKLANPLTEKLNGLLGLSSDSSDDSSDDSDSSSGTLPSGDEMIGDYTKQFESGDAGPESVSNSSGDQGGTSFGTYQFPSYGRTPSGGLLQKFWETYYAKDYPNVSPGDNSAFKSAWKAAVAKDKKLFHKREWMIAKTGDYDTALGLLKSKFNYDPDKDSRAAQEAIWSTAMQGPAIVPGDYRDAFGNTDSTSMDDAEWVKKFYASKRNRVYRDFSGNSGSIIESVKNRYVREEPIVAKLAGQKPLDYGKGRAMTSDLNDRIRSTNDRLDKGREQAEANARTDFIAKKIDSLKDENLGRGPGNGNSDNDILSKMLDIFQQVVPILKNIETNTGRNQTVESGKGPESRNAVSHKNFGSGTERTVTPRTKRARLGAVVDVGTTSVDKITRR